MRPRMIIAGMTLTLAGSLATPVHAEDDYRHGRLRYVEPGVSVQGASGVGAEEADANEPFLPGDRVWTNAAGRAEFQFPDGSLARLDLRSKLDYSGHEEQDGDRIVLRLWSGSLYLRTRSRDTRFEIETPAGTARGSERSLLRVDVDAGEARISVYEGEGLFDNGQTSLRLTAGQRTFARWGERIEDYQEFDVGEQDDFDRWNAGLDAQNRSDGNSARYLPDELDSYASDFDSNGDWRYETTVGYVWVPRVEVGWHPYWHGRWCWTAFGWTWVPYESWGWAPSHYGRWGYASYGWYWIPDRTWGPAWVSWAVGGGYVAWCPLGRQDRPVRDWDPGQNARHERGHAVPRGGRADEDAEAWNVVPSGELAQRDVAQRPVSFERAELAALQAADSARLRPTRDARRLAQGETTARAISTRPTMGDFVRELAVDNKTTIPAPWFRSGAASRSEAGVREERRAAPASVGGAMHTESSTTAERRAPWFAPSASGAARDGARSQDASQSSERRAPRPSSAVPATPAPSSEQHSPATPASTPSAEPRWNERAPSTPSSSRGTESRPRELPQAAPVHSGGASETAHPRDEGTSTSRPRESGAASGSQPSGASATPRSSGGQSQPASSGGARSSQGGGGARERQRR